MGGRDDYRPNITLGYWTVHRRSVCADMAGPGDLEFSCRYRRRCTLSWFDRSQQEKATSTSASHAAKYDPCRPPICSVISACPPPSRKMSWYLRGPARRGRRCCLFLRDTHFGTFGGGAHSCAVSHPGACSRRNSARNGPCGHCRGGAHSGAEAHSGDNSPRKAPCGNASANTNRWSYVRPRVRPPTAGRTGSRFGRGVCSLGDSVGRTGPPGERHRPRAPCR